MMKKKSAILCGVSTLVLAASLSSIGVAYADNGDRPPSAEVQNLNKEQKTKKAKKKKAKKHTKKSSSSSPATPSAQAATAAPAAKAEKVAMDVSSGGTQDKITTSNASANIAATDNVSQLNANVSTYQWLHKNIEMSYFGVYRGAALGDLGNSYQPNLQGNPDPSFGAQGVESFITTGYKFGEDKTWMIGMNTHFFYNAAAQPSPVAGQQINAGIEMLNPSIELTKSNIINSNGWKLKGYLFGQLPVSQYDVIGSAVSPGAGGITAIEVAGNLTYDIPGTRWTVGYYTYITNYIYAPSSTNATGYRTIKYYGAPNANYQITPTVAGTLWIDGLQVTRAQGTPFLGGLSNYTTDIEPGIAWDIIPGNLTVNPVINFYPGYPTLAATSVQAVIIGRAW
jgi:hypothetical protein